jgi:hypothetical protein
VMVQSPTNIESASANPKNVFILSSSGCGAVAPVGLISTGITGRPGTHARFRPGG